MIPFTKAQGAGNDFVLFDAQRCPDSIRDPAFIQRVCNRHTGVGADGVIIKDNHIAAMAAREVGLAELVRRARREAPHTVRVEVEVESLEQVQEALEGGADVLMLDNMDQETMRQAADLCRGKALTEASGGITLETVRRVAETGVDLISTGSITHSVHAMDISLSVVPTAPAR